MLGSSLRKLLYRPQNSQAELRRAGRERGLLQAAFRAFQSEFFSLAFRFHKSAGDDQKNRTRRQGASRSAPCGVRKKAERQTGGVEQRDARPIAQQGGRVPRVRIAYCPQILVVAANECRTTAHSGTMQDRPVELLGKFDHGYRFVEILICKKLRRESSEGLL